MAFNILPTGMSFQRLGQFPLDSSAIHNTLADAMDYAMNNPTAYPGQILYVADARSEEEIQAGIEASESLYMVTASGELKLVVSKKDLDMNEMVEEVENKVAELKGDLNGAVEEINGAMDEMQKLADEVHADLDEAMKQQAADNQAKLEEMQQVADEVHAELNENREQLKQDLQNQIADEHKAMREEATAKHEAMEQAMADMQANADAKHQEIEKAMADMQAEADAKHVEMEEAAKARHAEMEKDVADKFAALEKFRISNVPEGTIVDHRDKEIRVMCPKDAVFTKQQVGENGNPNMYYMTFTVYAPEGAVALREGDRGVIVDEVIELKNVDNHGRKFKNMWLALANFNGSEWSYFGKNSSLDKYIGWNYVVEFLDADGKVIAADSIRINLSNEDCHMAVQPYPGFRIAEKAVVDKQIEDLDKKVEDKMAADQAAMDAKHAEMIADAQAKHEAMEAQMEADHKAMREEAEAKHAEMEQAAADFKAEMEAKHEAMEADAKAKHEAMEAQRKADHEAMEKAAQEKHAEMEQAAANFRAEMEEKHAVMEADAKAKHEEMKAEADAEHKAMRELVDIEEPYLADVAAYPTSKFLFACGIPVTVEPNAGQKFDAEKPEDAVAFVYRWAEGFKSIVLEKEEAAKVYVVGGHGTDKVNVKRPVPQTNILVKDVKIKGVVGGSYFEGMVGHANVELINAEVASIIGAGWCGASLNGKVARMNVVDGINIIAKNSKITSTLFGGPQGNGVADDVRIELNNCEVGWLTAGGANGMTRDAVVVMNGGTVKVAQSTNRGVVHKARFIMNDGLVNKLYFGGETEDASVDGLIEEAFVELNGGRVKEFNFGTNNGEELKAENIKGSMKECEVVSGDVSMLEQFAHMFFGGDAKNVPCANAEEVKALEGKVRVNVKEAAFTVPAGSQRVVVAVPEEVEVKEIQYMGQGCVDYKDMFDEEVVEGFKVFTYIFAIPCSAKMTFKVIL